MTIIEEAFISTGLLPGKREFAQTRKARNPLGRKTEETEAVLLIADSKRISRIPVR